MESAHPHLLMNHFPIVGLMIAFLAFAIGMVFKSKPVRMTGLALIILTSLFVIPVNQTGEAAEEVVEHIVGVSDKPIHEHEEWAEKTLIVVLITAGLSLLAFWAEWKSKVFSKWLNLAVVFLGLTSIGFSAGTGYLGGKIRHTEIDNPAPAQVEHDDD